MNIVIKLLLFLFVCNLYAQNEFCRYLDRLKKITVDGEIIHNGRNEQFLIENNQRKVTDLKPIYKGDTLILKYTYYTRKEKGNEFINKKHVDKYVFMRFDQLNYKPISKLSKDFFNNDMLRFERVSDLELKIDKFKKLSFEYEDKNLNKFTLEVINKKNNLYIKNAYDSDDKSHIESQLIRLNPITQNELLDIIAESGIKFMDVSFEGTRCSHCNTDYDLKVHFQDSKYEIKNYQISPFYLRCLEKYLLSFFKFYED